MNVLKDLHSREQAKNDPLHQYQESRTRETRDIALLGSIGSSEAVRAPPTASSELRALPLNSTKRLMSQQVSRKR